MSPQELEEMNRILAIANAAGASADGSFYNPETQMGLWSQTTIPQANEYGEGSGLGFGTPQAAMPQGIMFGESSGSAFQTSYNFETQMDLLSQTTIPQGNGFDGGSGFALPTFYDLGTQMDLFSQTTIPQGNELGESSGYAFGASESQTTIPQGDLFPEDYGSMFGTTYDQNAMMMDLPQSPQVPQTTRSSRASRPSASKDAAPRAQRHNNNPPLQSRTGFGGPFVQVAPHPNPLQFTLADFNSAAPQQSNRQRTGKSNKPKGHR